MPAMPKHRSGFVRTPPGARLEVQRPSPGMGRDLGDAEPAFGRGQYPLRRWLAALVEQYSSGLYPDVLTYPWLPITCRQVAPEPLERVLSGLP
jgi:hypothetical protein